jgi:hypothetical protein
LFPIPSHFEISTPKFCSIGTSFQFNIYLELLKLLSALDLSSYQEYTDPAALQIGIIGDAGVRAAALQPKMYMGMVMILIFAEVLGEFLLFEMVWQGKG